MTATATPDWLVRPEVGLCPCGCIGKRRKGGFVEKTIGGAAGVMSQAMFSDDIAAKPGLLQAIDPRVKIVTFLTLLVAASLVRHIPILIALYLATLVLAADVEALVAVLREARCGCSSPSSPGSSWRPRPSTS